MTSQKQQALIAVSITNTEKKPLTPQLEKKKTLTSFIITETFYFFLFFLIQSLLQQHAGHLYSAFVTYEGWKKMFTI